MVKVPFVLSTTYLLVSYVSSVHGQSSAWLNKGYPTTGGILSGDHLNTSQYSKAVNLSSTLLHTGLIRSHTSGTGGLPSRHGTSSVNSTYSNSHEAPFPLSTNSVGISGSNSYLRLGQSARSTLTNTALSLSLMFANDTGTSSEMTIANQTNSDSQEMPPVKTSTDEGSLYDSASVVNEATTVDGEIYDEQFVATVYTQFQTLTAPLSTVTTDDSGRTVPLIVGPSGQGWQVPNVPTQQPELPLPTFLPIPPRTTGSQSLRTLTGDEITSTSLQGVSKNTKTTTTENGHHTVLPILFCLLCKGRSGHGGGLSWIIHKPGGGGGGGIGFHIPKVKFSFKIKASGDIEPLDPSQPDPEPEDDEQENKSGSSEAGSSTTTTGSERLSSTTVSSTSFTSSSSSILTASVKVATNVEVGPMQRQVPRDQVEKVQIYLSSIFATEYVSTAMATMISSSSMIISTAVSTDESESSPASSSSAAAPPVSFCECDGNGCTDDSPECCATGSCPASIAAVPKL